MNKELHIIISSKGYGKTYYEMKKEQIKLLNDKDDEVKHGKKVKIERVGKINGKISL